MAELSTIALGTDPNLEAYYRFSTGANTTDSSANSNTLTHLNTPTNTASGKYGYAMDYELSSSEYSKATDSASLSITGDISFSTWIKLEQLPSTAGTIFAIAGKYDSAGVDREYLFYIEAAAGASQNKLSFNYSSDGSNINKLRGTTAFVGGDLGNWINVIVATDVSAKTATFWTNGVDDGGTLESGTQTSIQDGASDFTIGAIHGGGIYFDGVVDDLGLFSRLLTQTDANLINDISVGGLFFGIL